jgi:hypothetical protein
MVTLEAYSRNHSEVSRLFVGHADMALVQSRDSDYWYATILMIDRIGSRPKFFSHGRISIDVDMTMTITSITHLSRTEWPWEASRI